MDSASAQGNAVGTDCQADLCQGRIGGLACQGLRQLFQGAGPCEHLLRLQGRRNVQAERWELLLACSNNLLQSELHDTQILVCNTSGQALHRPWHASVHRSMLNAVHVQSAEQKALLASQDRLCSPPLGGCLGESLFHGQCSVGG